MVCGQERARQLEEEADSRSEAAASSFWGYSTLRSKFRFDKRPDRHRSELQYAGASKFTREHARTRTRTRSHIIQCPHAYMYVLCMYSLPIQAPASSHVHT
jgi:hypothetical protein